MRDNQENRQVREAHTGWGKKPQRLTSKSYCKGAWIYLNQIEHSVPHGSVKNNRAIMQPLRKHFRWGWYQQRRIVKQKDQKKYTGQVEPSKNQCHSRVIVQTSKYLISEKQCQSFNTTGEVDFNEIAECGQAIQEINKQTTARPGEIFQSCYYILSKMCSFKQKEKRKNYKAWKEAGKHNPHMGEKSKKEKLPESLPECQIKQSLQGEPF